uniref:Uncharacterized protein n=1 Tax=Magnetococcus massalia (strain MO-1) TaxID=451514 RepID=A0A1S7LES3_MAGMO|nr:protein of unknown function [Candidatus Magnetococcus massalia]
MTEYFKSEGGLDRNFLGGVLGDQLNPLMVEIVITSA